MPHDGGMNCLDISIPEGSAARQRLDVRPALSEAEITQCQQWLGEEHFLGPAKTAGQRLFQAVYEDDQPVAVLIWAASAWHLKDRDE